MSALLLAVLMRLAPHSSCTPCLVRRASEIAARADAAALTTGVPPGLLLAVGWYESRLGCDPRSGGSWGAPINARHRGTAGTHDHAARALARSYRVCGTWLGAVTRFRSGRCRFNRTLVGYEASEALRLTERVYTRADVPVPVLR